MSSAYALVLVNVHARTHARTLHARTHARACAHSLTLERCAGLYLFCLHPLPLSDAQVLGAHRRHGAVSKLPIGPQRGLQYQLGFF